MDNTTFRPIFEQFNPRNKLHMDDFNPARIQLTDQLITALSGAIEAKDHYTNGHSQRVAQYSAEIGRRLGWGDDHCLRVYYTGILHDVGKISVSDTILNKRDALTDVEYAAMRLHTIVGYYILKEVSSISDFAIGARWHHERYDGKGYPNGLSRENIPLISRIIGVADAYDAMTSSRSYRGFLSREQARAEIEKGMGTQFDPVIAGIMLEMIDEDVDFTMRQPEPRAKYDILAIDDDPMELKLLDFMLNKDGRYNVSHAHSGQEGLDLFNQRTFDLVLLDVEMPEMNGFQVLEQIRNTNDSIPVVFLTGDKDMGNILKAESMGVSDYLTKPLIQHMLYESIENVLFSNVHGRPL